jgi:Cu(I)/Ag(I) efflux system membrane protein CusA/SilA
VPALIIIFVRRRIVPEPESINRFLIWVYRPVIKGVMRAKTRLSCG